MTENQIRRNVVKKAMEYLFYNEADDSYKKIIDVYNNHKPLARGYRVKYTDSWCATYISVISIMMGYTDIMPTECGCEQMIELYKKLGRWEEKDFYNPNLGDIIFYDWNDNGVGDNIGYADHVGMVVEVDSSNMKIIEGNKDNAVGYRKLSINAKYIRGYGLPDFSKKVMDIDDSTYKKIHIVKEGDTLSKIAKQYKTAVDNLVKINSIKNKDIIKIGEIIKIE